MNTENNDTAAPLHGVVLPEPNRWGQYHFEDKSTIWPVSIWEENVGKFTASRGPKKQFICSEGDRVAYFETPEDAALALQELGWGGG